MFPGLVSDFGEKFKAENKFSITNMKQTNNLYRIKEKNAFLYTRMLLLRMGTIPPKCGTEFTWLGFDSPRTFLKGVVLKFTDAGTEGHTDVKPEIATVSALLKPPGSFFKMGFWMGFY